jgi:hypothetical protein
MRCLKVILSAISVLPVLVSAATVDCFEDFQEPANLAVNDLISLKNFLDGPIGSTHAIKLLSLFGQTLDGKENRFSYKFFFVKICMANDFLFEGTTILAAEMSDFVRLNIECINRVGRDSGKMKGDTQLEVRAAIRREEEQCPF